MKESDIVRAILKYLKTVPDCFCWKEHGGMYGTAGIPDIICCYRGKFIAFGKVYVAAQKSVINKLSIFMRSS